MSSPNHLDQRMFLKCNIIVLEACFINSELFTGHNSNNYPPINQQSYHQLHKMSEIEIFIKIIHLVFLPTAWIKEFFRKCDSVIFEACFVKFFLLFASNRKDEATISLPNSQQKCTKYFIHF